MTDSGSTRRQFLRNAGVASSAIAAGAAAAPVRGAFSCLDYRSSFICGTSDLNSVRFWIESRTTITDMTSSESTIFYQCSSCKSEHTFAEKDLFMQDNYDFLPIFGGGHLLIFRRHARMNQDRYRQVVSIPNGWGEPRYLTHEGKNVRVLNTWEDTRDATAEGVPLVSQTELINQETSLKAVIECPVKTMNISHEKQMYQTDTGPVAFPDLAQRSEPLINSLSLAFVAFNREDFADFVIEQPTAVVEDGKELCSIYHYSNPVSLSATNRILTHD